MIKFSMTVDVGPLEEDLYNGVRVKAMRALLKVNLLLENRIKKVLSIPGTGRWYRSKLGGKAMHQASVPGEPPAPDTAHYRASIQTAIKAYKYVFEATVGSNLWTKYGRRLELGGFGGGAYIAPRPHIRRVWDESESDIQEIIDKEFE